MILNTKVSKVIFLFSTVLVLLFTMSGCVSVDKDDAVLTLEHTRFEYHEETDITTVTCRVRIDNNTIYNISSFSVDLGVCCNGVQVENEPYHYEYRVKHGKDESTTISFNAPGEVDQVALVKWTPNYETVWKTYLTEIVVLIVLAVISIVYWITTLF